MWSHRARRRSKRSAKNTTRMQNDRLAMPREKESSRRTLVAVARDIAIVVSVVGYFVLRSRIVIAHSLPRAVRRWYCMKRELRHLTIIPNARMKNSPAVCCGEMNSPT